MVKQNDYLIKYEIEQYDSDQSKMVEFSYDMEVSAGTAEEAIKKVQGIVALDNHIFPDHITIVELKQIK